MVKLSFILIFNFNWFKVYSLEKRTCSVLTEENLVKFQIVRFVQSFY